MKKKVVDTIYHIIQTGVDKGIGHLYTEDSFYNGTTITINGSNVVNFGSYSYLGLEHDNRLKEGAKEAIDRFGIQFGSSRTYLSTTLYSEMESLVDQLFNAHAVLVPTTTLGHMAVMPIVIEEGDVIVMDQNVHSSVQFMVKHLELQGVPNVVLRHNDIDGLENQIIELSRKYNKVWYMADSVYSMYGDVAPLKEIEALTKKYKKFYFYVDDAHGMSWAGPNGTGYVLSKIELSEKIVLATSLNKAFAAGGSAFVFTDKTMKQKVKTCGGPLIFAGQHLMSALGAGIACAKIHLSDEINELQASLAEKVKFCSEELSKRNLPDMSDAETPIFFIGVGLPKVGYNVIGRLQNDGFHVNLAIFPAVSENCTGVRFSVNVYNTKEEIVRLVDAIDYHLYEALAEEGRSVKDIERNFKRVRTFKLDEQRVQHAAAAVSKEAISIERYTSIEQIPDELAAMFLRESALSKESLLDVEHAYSGNLLPEENADFDYVVAYKNAEPMFFTFFNHTLVKEDILEPEQISLKMEQFRSTEPYYMCSTKMIMGSPLSFGNHVWSHESLSDKNKNELLDTIQTVFSDSSSNEIILRDMSTEAFGSGELEGVGYIHMEGLPTYRIEELQEFSYEDTLKSSQRYFVRKRALKREGEFKVSFEKPESPEQIEALYQLYQNTHDRNLRLNTFQYPRPLFDVFAEQKHQDWEILQLFMEGNAEPIGMAISSINGNTYSFLIAGLDYSVNVEMDTYAQLLHQLIMRAKSLGLDTIDLGYTTGYNKMKFGAQPRINAIFNMAKDDFQRAQIQAISLKEAI